MKREAQVRAASRGLYIPLRGILGYAVVGRGHAWMVFRYRKDCSMPVVRHGTGVDQPGHLVLHAELKDIDGSLGVGAKVCYRIVKRSNDGDLARDVADRVEPSLEDLLEFLAPRHITAKIGRTVVDIFALSRRFVVDDGNAVTCRQHAFGNVRSDKTGAAGYKHLHSNLLQTPLPAVLQSLFKQMRARLRARCCLHLDLALRRNQRLVEEFEVGGNPTPEPANTRLHPDLGMPPHQALRFLNVADVARLIARTPLSKPHWDLFAIQFDENLAKLVPYGQ